VGRDLGPEDIQRLYGEKFDEAVASLGRVNLALFGKTGAGKSTLINAVFGYDAAATGTGAPVTRDTFYYLHPSGTLGIYDSQGFEVGHSGDEVIGAIGRIVADGRTRPLAERLHLAWYVLRWSDRRFEKSQAEFVRRLNSLGLPVMLILTQVPIGPQGQVHPEAWELARYVQELGLPLAPDNRIFLTNARPDDFLHLPVHGLQDLVDATFAVAPDGVQNALAAAQQIDLTRKRRSAIAVIRGAVAAASATGVTPIPFADAAILVPIQVTMIAKITAAYGLWLPRARSASLVGSVAMATGATTAGRWLVGNAVRVIPGGYLIGATISGGVAASITAAMGYAWIGVVERVIREDPDAIAGLASSGKLAELFETEFRRRLRLSPGGPPPELEQGPPAATGQ
jgi:uncharacterized protein (DUF697 family)/GTP-binding protein EngB required for normal cell division